MSTLPHRPRRFLLGAAATLLISAPLSTFAADSTGLRMGQTRAEVEKLINTQLVEEKTSAYKHAFQARETTEAMRSQLPQPLSRLEYQKRMFYFDDAGKLWRVRFTTQQPANEGFSAMQATAALLERDEGLKRVQQGTSPKILDRKIPVPTRCHDDDGNRLRPKQAKLLADRWKTYSQPERYAISMNLSCNSINIVYLSHRFISPNYTWHAVHFEAIDGPALVRINDAEPAMAQVDIVYLMMQGRAADEPDFLEAEYSMRKEQ